MPYTHMFDTNIVSDIVRHPFGSAATQIRRHPKGALCLSVVVVAELYFGAAKVRSMQLRRRIDAAVDMFELLPFDAACAESYAVVRSSLERLGTPIGGNDMFIAAHAVALDIPLVTANIREFSRVPDLRVENWLD